MHSLRPASQRSHSLQLGSGKSVGFLSLPCFTHLHPQKTPVAFRGRLRVLHGIIEFVAICAGHAESTTRPEISQKYQDLIKPCCFYWKFTTWVLLFGRFSKGSGVSQTLPTLCALPQCCWHAGKTKSRPIWCQTSGVSVWNFWLHLFQEGTSGKSIIKCKHL